MKRSARFELPILAAVVAFGFIVKAEPTSRWSGTYQRVATQGQDVLRKCGDIIKISTSLHEGNLRVLFEAPGQSAESFAITNKMTTQRTRPDDFDWGLVQYGGEVGSDYALMRDRRLSLILLVVPMMYNDQIKVRISKDGLRLRVSKSETNFGIGLRSRCDYIRVQ